MSLRERENRIDRVRERERERERETERDEQTYMEIKTDRQRHITDI